MEARAVEKKEGPKKKLFALFASVICIFLWTKDILFKKNPAHVSHGYTAAQATIPPDLAALVKMRENDTLYDIQGKLWEGDWGRDPFKAQARTEAAVTPSVQVVDTENLTLQGIFWEEENPKVIINDKLLSRGDSLGSYKVMEIKPRSVVLWTGQKEVELNIFRPLIKSSPENTSKN